MANYRKQFNFRNGVQVDDDNLVVSPTGLVGIGTTVPTQALDVRGDVTVSGFVTASSLRGQSLDISGTATIQNLSLANAITGSGVSVGAGIITASDPSGVVTYYGDGGRLLNLPTSQWLDIDVGLGFTSIYNRGYVGVSTNDPRFSLQIGGGTVGSTFTDGVGINSNGNILATGIVTATKFVGVGSDLTLLNASNLALGTISNDRIPVLLNSKIPNNFQVSGIVTSLGGFIGTVTGNVTGNLTGNVTGNVSGNVTGDVTGNLTGNVSGNVTGNLTGNVTGNLTGNVNSSGIVTSPTFHVGAGGTHITLNSFGRIGIGSTTPTKPFEIFTTGIAEIELVGTESRIVFAEEKTTGIGIGDSAGVVRFGNGFKNFEFLNYDSGDFNYYIHAGSADIAGITTGSFNWIYGQDFSNLMSLTYDGKLGIGLTNPGHKLHVVGTSTVTGDAYFGGDVRIVGILSATSLELPSIINSNVNNNTGVSTFNNIQSRTILVSTGSSIGIGTDSAIVGLDARTSDGLFEQIGIGVTQGLPNLQSALDVNGRSLFVGNIAIGTATALYDKADGSGDEALVKIYDGYVEIENGEASIINSAFHLDNSSRLGVGTTDPLAGVDFSNAGKGIAGGAGAFMIVPRNTTAERVGLITQTGAIIFNTDTLKFQGYTGVGWTDFH